MQASRGATATRVREPDSRAAPGPHSRTDVVTRRRRRGHGRDVSSPSSPSWA